MTGVIPKIIHALEQSPHVALGERLLEAALFIEKSRERDGWKGVSNVVDEAEASEEDITNLKAALMSFIEERPDNPLVGSAMWALGRNGDASMRGFFLAQLHCHYAAHRALPMGQAVAVLEVIDDICIYNFAPCENEESEKFRDSVGMYLVRNPDANGSVSV